MLSNEIVAMSYSKTEQKKLVQEKRCWGECGLNINPPTTRFNTSRYMQGNITNYKSRQNSQRTSITSGKLIRSRCWKVFPLDFAIASGNWLPTANNLNTGPVEQSTIRVVVSDCHKLVLNVLLTDWVWLQEVRDDPVVLSRLPNSRPLIWDEMSPVLVDTQKLEHLFESRAKDLITKVCSLHTTQQSHLNISQLFLLQ